MLPLAPDVTELVYAIGAGDRVVAVPASADYPPQVRALPVVNPGDLESILGQRPDLVIASTAGNDPRVVERLRKLAVPVFTADVTSLERLRQAAVLLGEVLDSPEQGNALADQMEGEIAAATRTPPGTYGAALFIVWWNPLMAAAPGTVHDELLSRAGLDNLAPAGAGRYPRLQPEVLLDRRLRVVVTTDESEVREALEQVQRSPAGRRLLRGEVAVITLPADEVSRPGPRLPRALALLSEATASLFSPPAEAQ